MASVKNLSRTAKIIIAVVVCVVIVGAGVGGAFYNQWKDLPEVVVASAELGSVSQHYSTTAQVQSREKTIYEALDGVVVNSVEVQVGDVVNEGTVLATFDTSALGDTLESKRKSYQRAKTAYDDAVDAAAEAEENLPKIEQQIAELEQKIEADRTSTTTTTAPAATAPATTAASSNTSSGGVLDSIINSIIGGSGTTNQLQQLIDALNGLQNGDLSSIMSSDQLSSLLNSSMGGISDQSQLVQLQAQKAVYEVITTETYLNTMKDAADRAQDEYEGYQAAMSMLRDGWTADCYGIVSEVNLTAGQTYTNETEKSGGLDFSALAGLLDGSGDYSSLINAIAGFSSSANDNGALVIEHYNNLYLSLNLGKYDLQNVKKGQSATIEYLDHTYSGTVTYISAVATESEGLDLGSMVGSLTGGSGSTTGAEAIVSIDNPDSSIVIGFDADVIIETGTADNVITVPVECLRASNNERYVYVYNPETRRVEYRVVTIGLSGDDSYQITSGLTQGEQVVKVIKGTGVSLEDDMRVKVVDK